YEGGAVSCDVWPASRPLHRRPVMSTLYPGGGAARLATMADKPADRTPASAPSGRNDKAPAQSSARAEIDAFLAQVRGLGPATPFGTRGRLIFALDATMSRQPTWDKACVLQADMFKEAAAVGGLDVQLIYYRGLSECRASQWISRAERL